MAPPNTFVPRDSPLDKDGAFTPSMANTIISVVALIVLICFCIGALFLLRRRRQGLARTLLPTHGRSAHHRRISISTSNLRHSAVYINDEKSRLMTDASSPVTGSVPEIRITFADEEGSPEKINGARVVIVTMGDSGTVGMEPVKEEPPPRYPTDDNDCFQALDLDRIGGIKEPKQWS